MLGRTRLISGRSKDYRPGTAISNQNLNYGSISRSRCNITQTNPQPRTTARVAFPLAFPPLEFAPPMVAVSELPAHH